MVDERGFAGVVAGVHGANLRYGDVRLVDEHQKVIGEEVIERIRGFTGFSSRECSTVVFDAGTETGFLHEFEVMSGAGGQSLGFEQFAFLLEVLQ
ncbi:MAG UNVERIFIED_CONTAM: hypothetical protein LVR18_20615 [Planctomycetaceae bacterium]